MKKIILFICLIMLFVLCGCDSNITISFDSNGGSNVEKIVLEESGKIEKPADPTKAGQCFAGWYLNDSLFDFSSTITKSIKLKAKWVDGVEIYFSGSGIDDFSVMFPKGVEADLPEVNRDGYRFISWLDENENEYTDKATFDAEHFLEANWEKIEVYNIVYKDGDITLKTASVVEGSQVEPYTPEKEGYTFKGWYTNPSHEKEFDFSNLNRSNAVYAWFDPNEYVVSFATFDSSKNIKVKYDSEYGDFPSISIINCTFIGWEYNGKRVFESDIYKYTEDIELHPILYISSKFYISDTNIQTVVYKMGSQGPYANVDKIGFVFEGWYERKEYTGEKIECIDTAKYANRTLYGKFVARNEATNEVDNALNQLVDYYMELLDGKTVYENLPLLSNDPFYGATIEWISDKPQVASNGVVTRTRENLNVSITSKITYQGKKITGTYNITLKEDIYKDISKSVITSYCYTANMGRRGVDEILLETADIINLAFAEAKANGELVLTVSYVNAYEKFKQAARDAGVRVIITVGPPSDPSVFEAIASSPALRKKFARNIVEAINKYGFAGVDIDWEYPTTASKANYTLLMKDIYEQVKENNPEDLVTSAIPAGPYTYPCFDLKNSQNYLDYINLMSYDMQGNNTTHHAALYANTGSGTVGGCSINETVNNFNGKSLGVPLNKIVIGAAFYGRMIETRKISGSNYLNVSPATDSKWVSITYGGVKNSYLSLSTCKEYWDSKAYAAYCYDTASNTFITYDNPRSLEAKCDYVVSKGVAGIMWWDYGSDSTGELIEAIHSKLSILK